MMVATGLVSCIVNQGIDCQVRLVVKGVLLGLVVERSSVRIIRIVRLTVHGMSGGYGSQSRMLHTACRRP